MAVLASPVVRCALVFAFGLGLRFSTAHVEEYSERDAVGLLQLAPSLHQHGASQTFASKRWPHWRDLRDAVSKMFGNVRDSSLQPAMEALESQFKVSMSKLMDEAEALHHEAETARQRIPAAVASSDDKLGTFANLSSETLIAVDRSWGDITDVVRNVSSFIVEGTEQMGQAASAEHLSDAFAVPVQLAEQLSREIQSCERQLHQLGNQSALTHSVNLMDYAQEPPMPMTDPTFEKLADFRDKVAFSLLTRTRLVANGVENGIADLASAVQKFWPAALMNVTPFFDMVEDTVTRVFEIILGSFAGICRAFNDSTDKILQGYVHALSP